MSLESQQLVIPMHKFSFFFPLHKLLCTAVNVFMSYWKAIRSQAVEIAAFVLKVFEEDATNVVFTAP